MPTQRLRVDRYLEPGQLLVSATPLTVKTVLGSCIAVCLWEPTARVGGINHYLLPRPRGTDDEGARFGALAVPALIEQMIEHGAAPGRLQASVVGGGHPVGAAHPAFVGQDNRDVAIEILARWAIPILREETGGDHGRKLLFDTGTGNLIIRRVRGPAREPLRRA